MLNKNYLVIYDICNDKRRRKVVKHLEKYGVRVQYSAFECELNMWSKKKFIKELEKLTASEDSVRMYKLPQSIYVINSKAETTERKTESVVCI